MPDLRIGTYLTALTQGCCPNLVYALVFNASHQALKKVAGVYSFVDFTSAALNDFKINLDEHAHRPHFYFQDLPAVEVASIPASLPDQPYWVEYLLKVGAGGRALDTLLLTERLWIQGGKVSYAPWSATDLDGLVQWDARVLTAYDSATSKLRFVAFLQKNGLLVTNPQSCAIQWLKRDGATIAQFNLTLQMPQMPGVFQTEIPVDDIPADEAMPIKVTITDSAGVARASAQAVVAWD